MEELNKNNPFNTPKGYFENFTDELMGKLNEKKIGLPKKSGFAMPADYFDNLHKALQKKQDAQETKVVQLHPFKKYYVAAASVAAILLVFFVINWNVTTEPTWEDLANADIKAYFDLNEYGLSTYEIAEVIPVDELEVNDILDNQFMEENVMDYLYENIEDIEDLNLEDYE
jgi:hypothetical protein